MKKILVPVDFSDLATEVIEKAGEIAKAFESEVYILHVSVPGPVFADDPSQPALVASPGLEELIREDHDLKAMVHYLHEKGVNACSALVHGPVINTILDEAGKFEADLIVIGTQSHGFLYRTFIGSVSDGVMRNSPCPVLIVPQP